RLTYFQGLMVSGSRDAWQRGQRTIWFNLVIGVSDEFLPRERSNENDRRTSKWQCEQLPATWVNPAASAFAMFNPARIISAECSSDATPAHSATAPIEIEVRPRHVLLCRRRRWRAARQRRCCDVAATRGPRRGVRRAIETDV